MKTLFRTDKHVLILLGIVGSAVLVAFPQQSAMAAHKGKTKKKIEITKDTIVIHPAVKLSAADAKAMDDILKKHSKTLYKVDTIQSGKVTQTQGVLGEGNMTAAAKAEAPMENQPGRSNRSHQVVCPGACNPQQVPPPPFSTVFKATDAVAKQKLIQELKPVLEKYQ
jgi:hypothetical protein